MTEQHRARYLIRVRGVVQGVGFRPFVYRLASSFHLSGWVGNDSSGVWIEAEGSQLELDGFVRQLTSQAPSLAYVEACEVRRVEPYGYTDFQIRESVGGNTPHTYISPDTGVCGDCLKELKDPQNRRYRYPFINCTNCGPRFTIITGLPYDRPFTTMGEFDMCEACSQEYHDPDNRRFHAQPIACADCGPTVSLLDHKGELISQDNYAALAMAVKLLKEGHILAVKGLGGYHLVCDALQDQAVRELRRRKARDGKPFALMVKDRETAQRYCHVSDAEKKLLESPRRPIVLLERRAGGKLAERGIIPDNGRLGIMLPYTPVHHLLFEEGLELLVMTSGNLSGEPICYKDNDAVARLAGIADYFLTHNREIHIRTDDSVTGVFRDRESIVRRSRGYVPYPIDISAVLTKEEWERWNAMSASILACGGELKNSFCLLKGNKAFLSHHIGDLENLETLKSFEDGIKHFKNIFSVEPGIIAYDKHPDYLSSQYAESLEGVTKFRLQHHHAHIASCMADNGISGPVIGVAFDGTGYGEDGRIWGGEFLTGGYSGFVRQARLQYTPMPGGAASIKEPWRMALSYLIHAYGEDEMKEIGSLREAGADKLKWVTQQLRNRVNTPLTSSMGRLFDGVSAILGLCGKIEYEGQAAIRLEAEAGKAAEPTGTVYPYEVTVEGNERVIRLDQLIRSIIEDSESGMKPALIAAAFHRTIADMTTRVSLQLRDQLGLNKVVLSGGVFQNRLLLEWTVSALECNGFHVYVHHQVPSNDGGLSLGQAVMALRSYMDRIEH